MVDLIDSNQKFEQLLWKKLPHNGYNVRHIFNVLRSVNAKSYKKGFFNFRKYSSFDLVVHNKKTDQNMSTNISTILINYEEENTKKYDRFGRKIEPLVGYNIGCFAMKVVDIFRLYDFIGFNKEEFDYEELKFIKKMLKVDRDVKSNDLICGIYWQVVDTNKKVNHTIHNFGNRLVMYYGSAEIYGWFGCDWSKEEIDPYKNTLTNIVNISTCQIKALINVFFFNDPFPETKELMVFNEPRTLLSILEEFHSDDKQMYHILKRLNNKCSDTQPMVYETVDKFLGKDHLCTSLYDWGSIFLKKWCISDFYSLYEEFNVRFQLIKCRKNQVYREYRHYKFDRTHANFKRRNKRQIEKFINEQLN